MRYTLCSAIASIVYSGTFNATATGDCSAPQMSVFIRSLPTSVKVAAELALLANPTLIVQVCSSASSSNPAVELFIQQLCEKLGVQ